MTQLSVEDRGKIIGMHESGMSNCQISKRLGISKSTVAIWIKRNDEEGDCTRKVGSERKRKTDDRYDRAVCRIVLGDRFATAADILKVITYKYIS